MKSGLLWFDANADKNLMVVIDKAAKRYREKFGVNPDTCYVNREQLKAFASANRDALPCTLNLSVLPKETIIKNHVWLGISNPTPTLAQIAQFEQARQAASETQAPRVAAIVKLISGAETDGTDAQDKSALEKIAEADKERRERKDK